MQIKKSREVDFERKKPTLFFLGLAMATALVLSAFEWQIYTKEIHITDSEPEEVPIFEVEHIPPSFREKKKSVKSESKMMQKVTSSIIDDFALIEDEIPMEELDLPVFEENQNVMEIPQLAEPLPDEDPMLIPDVMPQFPGGELARQSYLANHVNYLPMAKDAGISGKVFVQFTVDIDGTIKDIEVLKGIGGGLDQEAVRAVKEMPKWEPGFYNSRPVSVRFVMPITFSLR